MPDFVSVLVATVDRDSVALAVPVAEGDRVVVTLGVEVRLIVLDVDSDAVCVSDGVSVWLDEPVGLSVSVSSSVRVEVGVAVLEAEGVIVTVSVSLSFVGVSCNEKDEDCVSVGVSVVVFDWTGSEWVSDWEKVIVELSV